MKRNKSFLRKRLSLFLSLSALLIVSTEVYASQLIVHAVTHPNPVQRGQWTEVMVEVQNQQGQHIQGASVVITAGCGLFFHSKGKVIHGVTDANGVFRTPWRCIQIYRTCSFNVAVNKPGFQNGTATARVNITSQPIPVTNTSIIVHAVAYPDPVVKGQWTEVMVNAQNQQGQHIQSASVVITAGVGLFRNSNGTAISGITDANGVFRTPWKCTQCNRTHEFFIEVSKPGFQKGMVSAKVNIISQAVPSGDHTLMVHTAVYPNKVSKGQPATLMVLVLKSKNQPVAGANVKISTGGGFFVESNNRVIHGQTDAYGRFNKLWKCIQCAYRYGFNIEVTKPGFQKITRSVYLIIK